MSSQCFGGRTSPTRRTRMNNASVFGRLLAIEEQFSMTIRKGASFSRFAALRFVATMVVAVAAAAGATAQVPTGSIVGTVKDVQGLAVEGAKVTQGTNYTYNSITGSTGGYQFDHIDFGI